MPIHCVALSCIIHFDQLTGTAKPVRSFYTRAEIACVGLNRTPMGGIELMCRGEVRFYVLFSAF